MPRSKGFHAGLTVGAYFPNQHTADYYNGYGFDIYGSRYDFLNSLMYRRIVLEYGGAYGQQDLIAEALNVNHDEWTFSESDMPGAMYYNAGFMAGFNAVYRINRLRALLLNVNAAQMSINGNFTITVNRTPIGPAPPGYQNYSVFDIAAREQRLILQLGYQQLLGEDDKVNFFYEGGLLCTITRSIRQQIKINDLIINLDDNFNDAMFAAAAPQNIPAFGFGMFGGFGINISTSSKLTLQLLYTPSYENLYFGDKPAFKLQHAAGLRGIW
jgi:hypothetical protein